MYDHVCEIGIEKLKLSEPEMLFYKVPIIILIIYIYLYIWFIE